MLFVEFDLVVATLLLAASTISQSIYVDARLRQVAHQASAAARYTIYSVLTGSLIGGRILHKVQVTQPSFSVECAQIIVRFCL